MRDRDVLQDVTAWKFCVPDGFNLTEERAEFVSLTSFASYMCVPGFRSNSTSTGSNDFLYAPSNSMLLVWLHFSHHAFTGNLTTRHIALVRWRFNRSPFQLDRNPTIGSHVWNVYNLNRARELSAESKGQAILLTTACCHNLTVKVPSAKMQRSLGTLLSY